MNFDNPEGPREPIQTEKTEENRLKQAALFSLPSDASWDEISDAEARIISQEDEKPSDEKKKQPRGAAAA